MKRRGSKTRRPLRQPARRSARRAAHYTPWLESLEARQMLVGNLSVDEIQFVDVDNRPIDRPVVGQQIQLRVQWSASDIPLNTNYRLTMTDTTVGVRSIVLNSNNFTGGGNGVFTFETNFAGWYATPGYHFLEVVVDSAAQVVELNESDNKRTINFEPSAPTTLPEKLRQPLAGQQNVDWSITHYSDLDPRIDNGDSITEYRDWACDDALLPDRFKCGPVTEDQFVGLQFQLPNYAAMDDGQAVYSVAGGTVTRRLNGFVMDGIDAGDAAGTSIAALGDVNGDGLRDLLITAPGGDSDEDGTDNVGEAYVVYGRPGGFPDGFSLADLLPENLGNGSRGFVLRGVEIDDQMGTTAVAAGDFNGDGLSDFAIGAPFANTDGTQAGAVYVVFGRSSNFPAEFDVADLLFANGGDGTQGVVLLGESSSDQFGASLTNAGDLNGDGVSDLAIGAPQADGLFPAFSAGRVYVVYGSTDPMPPQFDIAALFPTGVGGLGGFFIDGESFFDQAGASVAGVRDVNGDGADDLLIGAPRAGANDRGAAYVLFGHTTDQEATDPFPVVVSLADLRLDNGGDGTRGFVLDGADDQGRAGAHVAGLGDFNGDGLGDIAIGAPLANGVASFAGSTYVIYGSSATPTPERQLDFLLPLRGGDGSEGFVVLGEQSNDFLGFVSTAVGDLNGDGNVDLAVGAPGVRINNRTFGGVYVVYGRLNGLPAVVDTRLLGREGGVGGVLFTGPEVSSGVGRSLSAPGNFDQQGPDDLLIGAPFSGVGGQIYGVLGRTTPFRSEMSLALINDRDTVEVDHGGGWVSIYSYLEPDSITVQPGDVIPSGAALGVVGSRESGGALLHFELRYQDSPVETYIDASAYWQKPLEYQGQSDRSVLDSGVTNLDPTADLQERPSDLTRIHPTYQGDMFFWYRLSHLNPNDEYQVVWSRPNGTLIREAYHCMDPKLVPQFNPFCNVIDPSPNHFGLFVESLRQPWKDHVGTWQVALFVNGEMRVRQEFEVVSSPVEPEIRMEFGPLPVNNPSLLPGRSTPIDFGDVLRFGERPWQDFIIENHGSTALHLSDLVIPEGFRLLSPFPTQVNVDSRVRFTLEMLTDVPGDRFGEVRFTTDDTDEPEYRFLVSGHVRGNPPLGAPEVELPGPALSYQWQQAPQIVDDSAILRDSNSIDFANGRLVVDWVAGAASGDRLGIRNVGTSGGEIGISGNAVTYSGAVMGTWSGGEGTTPLTVIFNDQATGPAVQTLLRNITYHNVDVAPGTASKYVRFRVTDDTNNQSNAATLRVVPSPNNLNQNPSIASLVVLPEQIIQPAEIVFTANGVIDPDGEVSQVRFYVESNNVLGLQTGPGGDLLIGADANGVDGWSVNLSSSILTSGAKTGYAVAQDNLLAESLPAVATFTVLPPNQPPSIVFLSANPGQVIVPQATTLTANGTADVDGFVTRVDFYRESNGVPGFQPGGGGDLLIGTDTSSAGGWAILYSSNGLAEGLHTLYARATDNGGAVSAPVSTQLQVGPPPPVGSVFYLSDLLPPTGNGVGGFVVTGDSLGDQSGYTVSILNDINRDGFDDLIIGAPRADGGSPTRVDAGLSYVVFGKSSGFDPVIDVTTLNGTNGFRILGANPGDLAGYVASAGDVNGDGLGDMLIGAPGFDVDSTNDVGAAYVVFGRTSGFGAQFDLGLIDGVNGFRLDGIRGDDMTGLTVSGAGDFNGDGFADVLIGARSADPGASPRVDAGAAYLVYGKMGGFAPATDLLSLDPSEGFRVEGTSPVDFLGQSLRWAGDVNGDGLGDIILGAQVGQLGTNAAQGAAFVIFGSQSQLVSPLLVDQLNGTNGFSVRGLNLDDLLGFSVSGAGDYNGDGFGDIVIGVPNADPGATPRVDAGSAYLIFGAQGPFASQFDLTSLGGNNGFRIDGIRPGDALGLAVGAAGDVNGDGYDDVLLGAFRATVGSPPRAEAGETYVLFGSPINLNPTFELSSINGQNGFRIEGVLPGDQSGWSVAGGGDINGDGYDDLLIGAPASDAGSTYIFFGRNFTGSTTQNGTATADSLNGSLLADILNGRQSNDELAGNGGVDVLIGGQGADVLGIGDLNFRRVVGGRGLDTLRFDGANLTLDLTGLPDSRVKGIERIDMRGTGDNRLILDLQEVLNLSDDSNQLIVRRNEGDVVEIGDGWTLVSLVSIDGGTFYDFRQGAAQLLLQAVAEGTPWQNPLNPLDVNNSGGLTPVTPIDAILVINFLNTNLLGNNPLPNPPTADFSPPPLGDQWFYDTSGDGFATPLDSLLVINFLNQLAGGEGEGQGEGQGEGNSKVANSFGEATSSQTRASAIASFVDDERLVEVLSTRGSNSASRLQVNRAERTPNGGAISLHDANVLSDSSWTPVDLDDHDESSLAEASIDDELLDALADSWARD